MMVMGITTHQVITHSAAWDWVRAAFEDPVRREQGRSRALTALAAGADQFGYHGGRGLGGRVDMSAIVSVPAYTPEDLLSLPDDGKGYELVGGRLVEKQTGAFASWLAARIGSMVARYSERRSLGFTLESQAGYQCFPDDPRKVRKPDVSFIRRGRFPDDRIPEGHIPVPPDLAVEVVSPNDTAYEVTAKVEEYLTASIPLVWVVYPNARVIHVYRAGGTLERLGETDELTAPDLLPDLRCRVADLFTLPPAP
jgi:Uma2 family endonuclease